MHFVCGTEVNLGGPESHVVGRIIPPTHKGVHLLKPET